MCERIFEAEIYCEVGPTIEFRDGMFHVEQRVGQNAVIRRCFVPNVFISSVVAALDAIDAFQAEQGGHQVIAFPTRLLRDAR